ncbi:putative Rho GTPase-activating protein domain, Rho GTPase activation protein [Pseudoloma neurophilia]|uniref:Putative Rho GTPase-activating protein domain, Rho GTPase activation protein n=1 Tax=Pseudoloma neurophilia TaxID=146866 RepID=A0A0R0LS99_9MICR|nr:putative Rho GTPase-activating protein domain, Rho GTPase activation protein [Pseudoloma neurophilia]
MNEDRITGYLKKFVESINDIHTPAFDAYKECFIKNNIIVIKKYVSFTKRSTIFLRNILNTKFFNFNGTFFKKNVSFSYTRIRLGKFKNLIPFEINCIMESILTKELNISGLFRQSTTIQNLNDCHLTVNQSKTLSKLECINNLLKFDLITLTSVYKQLYDQYPMSLVPKWLVYEFIKVSDISDINEKNIMLKYLIYNLPKANRNLLDSITAFFAMIQHLIENTDNSPVNMDMHGFAVVMMPKIFLKNNNKLELTEINKLIDILEYIFINRNILFSIGVKKENIDGIVQIVYYDMKNEPNFGYYTVKEEGSLSTDFETFE